MTLILMGFIPDMRSSLVLLPFWVAILGVIYALRRKNAPKTGMSLKNIS
jgi:L-asparagine transporter-like permease